MIGVRFTQDVRPHRAGGAALLPDQLGRQLIAAGEAEPYDFPDAPHAHEAGFQPAVTKPVQPAVTKPQQPQVRKGR
ncbi:hypothetical protein [Bradyrhizobium sp. SZCCHNRI2049]|uniref:hypothetical protein n=1 Tax=Bradyrhizobium sp. SZCCHNRI2049 TaxID=3057287 RepID=UPI0029163D3D|nr:hypothetical protein [Bradyrhizobium sp. SZCCHNRI2049]